MIDKTDPTNRDTVPAMLTPGEFVLNKEASTMFAPVIEQMNSAGLQHRAMKNMGGGIQNYNKGGYSFMKPTSKFRGALKDLEADSYSTLFANSEKKETPWKGVDITGMSMADVLALVKPNGAFHKYNKDNFDKNTTAVGKYQFVGSTLRDLKKRGVFEELGIDDDTPFNESTQDALAAYQAVHRVKDRTEGTMSSAREELRNEWEGFKKLEDNQLNDIINEISGEVGVTLVGTTPQVPTQAVSVAPITSIPPQMRPKDLAPQMAAGTIDTMASSRPQMRPNTQADPVSVEQAIMQASVPAVQAAPPVPTDFGEAFKDARADMGAGGIFNFRGRDYTTNYAEEEDMVTANMGGAIHLQDGGWTSGLLDWFTEPKDGFTGGPPSAIPGPTQQQLANQSAEERKSISQAALNPYGDVPAYEGELGTGQQDVIKPSVKDHPRYGEFERNMEASQGTRFLSDPVMAAAIFKKYLELNPLPDVNSDESLLQGSSDSVDTASKLSQEQLANQARDRRMSAVNEVYVPPLNAPPVTQPTQQQLANEAAAKRKVVSQAAINPLADVPAYEGELGTGDQYGPPPPTFMGDVVPYLGRAAGSLASNVGDTVNEFAASSVLPVGSVDVNREYRDIKSIIAGGVDKNGVPLTDNQIKAYNLRIKAIEKERDYNDRMEPFGAGQVFDTVIESGNQLAAGVNDYVTDKVGNVVSGFNPEAGASVLDSKLGYAPPPRRELTADEIEFNRLRGLTGATTPKPEKKGPGATKGPMIKTGPNGTILDANGKPIVNLTPQQAITSDAAAIAKAEADRIAAAGGGKNTPEVSGAMSMLKSVFGDLFDTKELMRAAIMYLGGRATGMDGQQALAFAGKNYIARIDAKEGTYQKVALEGKHTKESLAIFKKSMDFGDLATKGLPAVPTGDFKTMYDRKTGREITLTEKKVGDGSYWFDGNEQVDVRALTNDGRFAPKTAANVAYKNTIRGNVQSLVTSLDALNPSKNPDAKAGISELGIAKETIGREAVTFAIENGMELEQMEELVEKAYKEALVDSRSGKKISRLSDYFSRAWVEANTTDAQNFFLPGETKDGKPIPVPVANVTTFLQTIKNAAAVRGKEGLANMSDTQISSWLMQQESYKTWQTMDPELKKEYIKTGAASGRSGMMEYILSGMVS